MPMSFTNICRYLLKPLRYFSFYSIKNANILFYILHNICKFGKFATEMKLRKPVLEPCNVSLG